MEADEAVCKYCLQNQPARDLLKPCRCSQPGILSNLGLTQSKSSYFMFSVHIQCLEQWLLARPERGGLDNGDCLKCELCSSKLCAKILLAPITAILWDQAGRKMLLFFCIRLAYRIYLLRRLFRRYKTTLLQYVPRRLTRKSNLLAVKPRTLWKRVTTGMDLVVFAIIGSLSATLLWRDVHEFIRSSNSLRRAHATIKLNPASGIRSPGERQVDSDSPT